MSIKVAPTATLRVTRVIKAPRERVFAAWTTAEEIPKWFGPDTCRVLAAQVDLRVGGEFHFRVHGQEMGELSLSGVYREVKRPAKLVYTWNWKGNSKMEFGETLVTVDFVDKEGFTEVQITHDRFPNAELREEHNYGWTGCLDKLEKTLAGEALESQTCPEPRTFCWNEMLASDTSGATKFYTELFGWQTEKMPGMDYTVFKQGGKPVGGLMARPHEQAPPHWLSYVMVEDVDASVRKAAALGAQICMPPTDIPTVGRIAVFMDPQGAALGLFRPAKPN